MSLTGRRVQLSNDYGRIPPNDAALRNVFDHHGARANHAPRPDVYTGRYESLRRDPYMVAYRDRAGLKVKCLFAEIVRPRAKESLLRNTNMRTDRYRGKAEDCNFLPNPNVVPHLETPRKRNVYSSTNFHGIPNSRSKSSQYDHANRRRHRAGKSEEEKADDLPKRFLHTRRSTIEIGGGEATQIH